MTDDWPAAMHQLELLAKEGWAVRLERAGDDWWCDILGRGEQYRAKAATGPLAIYEAVGMVKGATSLCSPSHARWYHFTVQDYADSILNGTPLKNSWDK